MKLILPIENTKIKLWLLTERQQIKSQGKSNAYNNIEWKDDKPAEGLIRLPFSENQMIQYRHSYYSR